MVNLRSKDGKIIIKDNKVGVDERCCCDKCECPIYVSVRAPFGIFSIDPDFNPDIDECAQIQAHYSWMVDMLQHYGYDILSQDFYTFTDDPVYGTGCGFHIDARCCPCWLDPYWGNPFSGAYFGQSLIDYPDRWASAYSYNGGPPIINWGFGTQWIPTSFLFYRTPMDNPSEYYSPPLIEDATLPDFAQGLGEALPICDPNLYTDNSSSI